MNESLTEPAKLLLLVALLAKDRIISNNAKSFLKELILRRDPRLAALLKKFESKEAGDSAFLEKIHDLIQDEALALYNELFSDTSLEVGKTLSKGERDEKNLNHEKSLIYGEVEFMSFYRVLRKINPQPGLIFYDLGSGTSKAVFVARLTQDFGKCLGIEILSSLHDQGVKIVTRYNKDYRQVLCSGQSQHASVYQGSILEFNWMDGDVLFANSTCFDDSLMSKMSKMAEGLKPGAIFVTFTKGLVTPAFELLERKRYKMSWGPATVFIHRRLALDGSPVGPVKLNVLPSDSVEYDDEDDNSTAQIQSRNSSLKGEQGSDDDEEDDDEDDEDAMEDEEEEEDDEEQEEEEEDEEEDNGDYRAYEFSSPEDEPNIESFAARTRPENSHVRNLRSSPQYRADTDEDEEEEDDDNSDGEEGADAAAEVEYLRKVNALRSSQQSWNLNLRRSKETSSNSGDVTVRTNQQYTYTTAPSPAKSPAARVVDMTSPPRFSLNVSAVSQPSPSPSSRADIMGQLNSPQDSALMRRKAAR